MGLLAWLVIGIIAGWIAEKVTGSDHGLFKNLIVGIIGAFVGGFLVTQLGLEPQEGFWGSLVVAAIGATVFLFLWRAIRGRA